MANKLPRELTESLRRSATAKGAKSYAAWLRELTPKGENYGAAHAALAKESTRAAADYGAAGEQLAGGGLSDDGYAEYLRRAAKESRLAGHSAIEARRGDEGAEALRRYADYLDGVRREAGDALVKTAASFAESYTSEKERDSIINALDPTAAGASLLRKAHATLSPEEPRQKAGIAGVIDTLQSRQLPKERAIEYCRLLGYSEEEAGRIVEFVETMRSELSKELLEIFGY